MQLCTLFFQIFAMLQTYSSSLGKMNSSSFQYPFLIDVSLCILKLVDIELTRSWNVCAIIFIVPHNSCHISWFFFKKYSQTFNVYILQKKFAFMKYRYLYLTIRSGENSMHYGDIIKIIILIFVPFSILRNLSKKLVHEKIDLPDKCIQFRKD